MIDEKFQAFWVTETNQGFERQIITRQIKDLPTHDTLIRVHYSSLNYKDLLSISGNKGITKHYPHQPGIDASGVIIETKHPHLKPGDQVLCTGYDLGMNTDGGYGQFIRVPYQWVLPIPEHFNLQLAMAYGTAGFTAALGLFLLERNGQQVNAGPIVVTGATGGVGSLAVAMLAKAGYSVIASTGKVDSAREYLFQLGAQEIVPRDAIDQKTDKLLLKSQWAGAIDTVGGNTLHTLLKACKPYGNVACCGLVQSPMLDISVYPFIINGVSLLGMASAENPIETKAKIWSAIANEWNVSDQLNEITTVIQLNQLSNYVDLMQQGKIKGRVVIQHDL